MRKELHEHPVYSVASHEQMHIMMTAFRHGAGRSARPCCYLGLMKAHVDIKMLPYEHVML